MQENDIPVTDDDRKAREWADGHSLEVHGPWAPIARAIRAHVPAPPATLADELRTASWGDIPALADRVEAVEKENRAALNHAYDERDEALVERDEARTKVEEVEGHLSKSWRQRDAKDVELERLSREREQQEKALVEHGRLLAEARAAFDEVENRNLNLEADLRESHAEVERLTAERDGAREEIAWLRNGPGHTEVATDLPDPADVKPGEAWLVECFGEKRNAVKGKGASAPWNNVSAGGLLSCAINADVILVARLVPDTRRVIDRPEDLDKFPEGSIAIDKHGEPWRHRQMDWVGENYRRDDENLLEVEGPVTVIYTPEEES